MLHVPVIAIWLIHQPKCFETFKLDETVQYQACWAVLGIQLIVLRK